MLRRLCADLPPIVLSVTVVVAVGHLGPMGVDCGCEVVFVRLVALLGSRRSAPLRLHLAVIGGPQPVGHATAPLPRQLQP